MSVEDLAKDKAKAKPKFFSSAAFLADFELPEYVLDGVILRGNLYSLTGKTGHGKTAIALAISLMLDLGREYLNGKPVKRGKVIYFAAENPDDVRMRVLLMLNRLGLKPEDLNIEWVPGAFNLKEGLEEVEKKAQDATLIIVDTGPAFLLQGGSDEENSNAQMLDFAKQLRALTQLESRPAVLALMHPIKSARCQEDLLPRGGGSFVAEVDGNLTLWAQGGGVAELHWTGKVRGPDFEPIPFVLEAGTCPALTDANGTEITSVWARMAGPVEAGQRAEQQVTDEHNLMMAMKLNPTASMSQLAEYLGWRSKENQPQKSKVERILKRLALHRLVEKLGSHWKLTNKGKAVLKQGKPASEPDPAAALKAKLRAI
jgi:hypothetical protein